MRNRIYNRGKAGLIMVKYQLENASKIIIGNEECISIKWTEKERDNFSQKHPLNGMFNKDETRFIMCNLNRM